MKFLDSVEGVVLQGINRLAKKAVQYSANSTCIWVAYQPKFPKSAEILKKNK